MRSAAHRRPLGFTGALLLGLVALLSTLLLGAGPAAAAPYEVFSCESPSGAVAGSAWTTATSGPAATATNDCSGSGMRATLNPSVGHGGDAATLTFTAPAGTRISGYDLRRTLTATVGGFLSSGYTARVRTVGPDGVLGDECSGSGFSFQRVCTSGPSTLSASGVSLGSIVLTAACEQSSCPSASPAAEVALGAAHVVLEDPQAPALTGVGGTISDPARTTRTVVVAASDVGGGVASATASVDGGAVVRSDAGGACVVPYVLPQPCPSTREATFSVDATGLAAGDHAIAGTVTDAAGNAVAWGPVPFSVPSAVSGGSATAPPAGAIPVPVSSGATGTDGAPRPTARLTVTGARTTSGRQRPTGTLRAADGTPLAGVAVRVTRTRLGAKRPVTTALATVRTAKDGTYTAPALPEGAWTAAAAAAVPSGTVSATARLLTTLRITARPSPRRLRTGGRIVLSGTLTGAGQSRVGARVQIQTTVHGRWRTVASVRTVAGGRWTWRHRFTKVTYPTLFSFRAVVPGGGTWPWSTVRGRAPTVRVDPR